MIMNRINAFIKKKQSDSAIMFCTCYKMMICLFVWRDSNKKNNWKQMKNCLENAIAIIDNSKCFSSNLYCTYWTIDIFVTFKELSICFQLFILFESFPYKQPDHYLVTSTKQDRRIGLVFLQKYIYKFIVLMMIFWFPYYLYCLQNKL